MRGEQVVAQAPQSFEDAFAMRNVDRAYSIWMACVEKSMLAHATETSPRKGLGKTRVVNRKIGPNASHGHAETLELHLLKF